MYMFYLIYCFSLLFAKHSLGFAKYSNIPGCRSGLGIIVAKLLETAKNGSSFYKEKPLVNA